jgi:hypothetical protein
MEEAQSRSSSSKPKPSARKPVADSKTEEVKEPQLRVADTTVRTRELGVVNQYLEITRLRLAHLLENLRSEESSSLRLRKAIKKLMRVEGSEEFSDTFETLYADYSAVELGEYEWENRYAVHLLGALKALTEIREDFLGFENDTNLDNQVVEQLSPTGEWIACWVYLPGNKGKEPRTNLGRGFTVNRAMCLLELKIGRILHTKGVAKREETKWIDDGQVGGKPADYHETTSHRCHQSLCCNPAHLSGEAFSGNVARNYCAGRSDCTHMPERCLLPWHNSRVKAYAFIAALITRRLDPTNAESPRNVHRRKLPGEPVGKSDARFKRGKKPDLWRKQYVNTKDKLLERHIELVVSERLRDREDTRVVQPSREAGNQKRKRPSTPSSSDESDDDVFVKPKSRLANKSARGKY